MEAFTNHIMLSRIQFAFTAIFHILWPVLTIGLSLYILFAEIMWLKTKNEIYYRHARFWMRLFILNFAVGVVSGIPMEFQFGTNWGGFSTAGGDIFGHFMGFEASMAFMLEAAFLGVMVWGWKRVPRGMHLFATAMVAFGSSLSAFWIMTANAWMQTPAGGVFKNGRFVSQGSIDAILNTNMPWAVSHMWVACLEVTIFVVGGISAWCLIKEKKVDFFLKSFKIVVLAAIVITPVQIFLGDGSGRQLTKIQPTKLAAIEAHWNTNAPGRGAAWNFLAWPDESKGKNDWAVSVPNALSLLLTRSLYGQVKGLNDFPKDEHPPVWIPFYSFRVMLFLGGLFFLLTLWTLYSWWKGRLSPEKVINQKMLMYAWILALPLSYVAVEAGWITREVGRQPWVIYGVLRTDDAATVLPSYAVGGSLAILAFFYIILFVLFLLFAFHIVKKGPGESGE